MLWNASWEKVWFSERRKGLQDSSSNGPNAWGNSFPSECFKNGKQFRRFSPPLQIVVGRWKVKKLWGKEFLKNPWEMKSVSEDSLYGVFTPPPWREPMKEGSRHTRGGWMLTSPTDSTSGSGDEEGPPGMPVARSPRWAPRKRKVDLLVIRRRVVENFKAQA